MNDQIAQQILAELTAIRLLLAAQGTARPTAPAQAATAPSTDGPPPQPTTLVAEPGDVQVHFGKNNGVPLSQLGEKSLLWYAHPKPPRLDSAGKPYPPRPQDVALENAARQLWHTQAGTLAGAAPGSQGRTMPPARSQQTVDLDGETPPF
jgi:hypothetical protein